MKLILNDGSEYELIRIDSNQFNMYQEVPYPFEHVLERAKVHEGELNLYRYKGIRINGEYYGLKLIEWPRTGICLT